MDVMDGEVTYMKLRNVETSESLMDFFVTIVSMANRSEIWTVLAFTSDYVIVCAQLRCDNGNRIKVSRTIIGWDIDGLKHEE